jgi:hypothetical protein
MKNKPSERDLTQSVSCFRRLASQGYFSRNLRELIRFGTELLDETAIFYCSDGGDHFFVVAESRLPERIVIIFLSREIDLVTNIFLDAYRFA